MITYLPSKKISLRSKLALNMNMLENILISVTPDGGSECPTAQRPKFCTATSADKAEFSRVSKMPQAIRDSSTYELELLNKEMLAEGLLL